LPAPFGLARRGPGAKEKVGANPPEVTAALRASQRLYGMLAAEANRGKPLELV